MQKRLRTTINEQIATYVQEHAPHFTPYANARIGGGVTLRSKLPTVHCYIVVRHVQGREAFIPLAVWSKHKKFPEEGHTAAATAASLAAAGANPEDLYGVEDEGWLSAGDFGFDWHELETALPGRDRLEQAYANPEAKENLSTMGESRVYSPDWEEHDWEFMGAVSGQSMTVADVSAALAGALENAKKAIDRYLAFFATVTQSGQ